MGETQVNQHDITTPDLASVPQRIDILANTWTGWTKI